MKRFAFTMLELVFVIIVIGIIAVLAMPSFNSNPLQQAAEQVANHIRYTQHLAMVEDVYDPADINWSQKRWQIRFPHASGIYYYEIFSDKNKEGNSDANEEAIDPLTKENIGSGTYSVTVIPDKLLTNLTKRYGIKNVGGTCGVGGGFRTVAFDNLGRPYEDVYTGPYSNPVPDGGCTIILEHQKDGNATISITQETGYVSVTYN